jgi:hypothetical protein
VSADDNFLSRWSRRKLQARQGEPAPEERAPPAQAPAPVNAVPEAQGPVAEEAPLPPVESLTPQSDFTPFMKPQVDRGVRNQALKALFADPQFNVMDGLDVYIDDYSKPDPLPEGWLEKMTQVARIGAYEPPKPEADPPAEPQELPQPPAPQAGASETEKPEPREYPPTETG